jgi:Family of unknown function (DUF5519)
MSLRSPRTAARQIDPRAASVVSMTSGDEGTVRGGRPPDIHDRLIERCSELANAVVGDGAFSPGQAIWVGKRDIAHIDANGALDIRLTKTELRARRQELQMDSRITLRSHASDWLEFRVDTDEDLEDGVSLISDAIAANLPSAPTGPPPTGPELERRRRSH